MTDYNYQANKFGSKDALTTGQALKEIVGAEFEVEFVDIKAAVNSKLNSANPLFTGAMSGPSIVTTISGGTF
jgi:hypothetical protein